MTGLDQLNNPHLAYLFYRLKCCMKQYNWGIVPQNGFTYMVLTRNGLEVYGGNCVQISAFIEGLLSR